MKFIELIDENNQEHQINADYIVSLIRNKDNTSVIMINDSSSFITNVTIEEIYERIKDDSPNPLS